MSGEQFSGPIVAGRGGGAYVVLPSEVVGALGGGSRFRVRGQLNGVAFSSSTMGIGDGRVCLGVHKATRKAAGVSIGDLVAIHLERDTAPRELEVPEDLSAAFADDATARSAFEGMSFTHRREYVEWITSAKRPETRGRRLAATLGRLRAQPLKKA